VKKVIALALLLSTLTITACSETPNLGNTYQSG